jgi:ABC-type branched-subunit amino acid transport system substrate-binding protein
VVLQVEDAGPRDPGLLASLASKLVTAGAAAVVTASPTPTLAVYPLAASRHVLVFHQGYRDERLPATSVVLLHTRPSPAGLGRAAAAYARQRGARRLAVLAAGDESGKAARAGLAEAWRAAGGALVLDESLGPDSPDVAATVRRLVAAGAEGVVLTHRGEDLGRLAARLREAGVAAPLLLLDDDPIVALAGGPALADVLVLGDGFVDDETGAFAETYRAKHGREPSRFAAHAYDTVVLLARAAEGLVRQGQTPAGARLRDALRGLEVSDSAFPGAVGFAEDGTLRRPLALSAIERGRLHFIRYVEASAAAAPAAR